MKHLLLALALFASSAAAADKPNIILILVDDMPWFGTSIRMDAAMPESAMAFRHMPNVEKMSTQGMTFRNARAAAGMCAPSRCSIQTGMMTARHLFSGNGGFGSKTDGSVEYLTRGRDATLPLLQPEPQGNIRFPSIGDVLRSAGYATAHFGKWHLYGDGPAAHGYDESDGDTDNKGSSPIDPATGLKSDTMEDPKLMFGITQRSLDFISRQAKSSKPFYLQVSHYATHARSASRKSTLEKYQKDKIFNQISNMKEREHAILDAAMVEDLDSTIGMILEKIEQLDLSNNTYVIFTTDNGYHGWNQSFSPLRGGKWWMWDNGLRVPFIIRGPGIAAGSRSSVNMVGYDLLPTFADLAGATKALSKEVDGVSFKPILMSEPVAESYVNRALYFHYPHYRDSPPHSAIVMGEMKLLHFYEWPEDHFLFNLSADMGEKKNLAKADPEKAKLMQTQMMSHIQSVGGFFPKPNPKAELNAKRYDPSNLDDQQEKGNPEDGDADKPASEKKNK